MIRFIQGGGSVQKDVYAIYKNENKLACEIPDLGSDVPIG